MTRAVSSAKRWAAVMMIFAAAAAAIAHSGGILGVEAAKATPTGAASPTRAAAASAAPVALSYLELFLPALNDSAASNRSGAVVGARTPPAAKTSLWLGDLFPGRIVQLELWALSHYSTPVWLDPEELETQLLSEAGNGSDALSLLMIDELAGLQRQEDKKKEADAMLRAKIRAYRRRNLILTITLQLQRLAPAQRTRIGVLTIRVPLPRLLPAPHGERSGVVARSGSSSSPNASPLSYLSELRYNWHEQQADLAASAHAHAHRFPQQVAEQLAAATAAGFSPYILSLVPPLVMQVMFPHVPVLLSESLRIPEPDILALERSARLWQKLISPQSDVHVRAHDVFGSMVFNQTLALMGSRPPLSAAAEPLLPSPPRLRFRPSRLHLDGLYTSHPSIISGYYDEYEQSRKRKMASAAAAAASGTTSTSTSQPSMAPPPFPSHLNPRIIDFGLVEIGNYREFNLHFTHPVHFSVSEDIAHGNVPRTRTKSERLRDPSPPRRRTTAARSKTAQSSSSSSSSPSSSSSSSSADTSSETDGDDTDTDTTDAAASSGSDCGAIVLEAMYVVPEYSYEELAPMAPINTSSKASIARALSTPPPSAGRPARIHRNHNPFSFELLDQSNQQRHQDHAQFQQTVRIIPFQTSQQQQGESTSPLFHATPAPAHTFYRLIFSPISAGSFQSLFLIRNNLTRVELVLLRGYSTRGSLTFRRTHFSVLKEYADAAMDLIRQQDGDQHRFAATSSEALIESLASGSSNIGGGSGSGSGGLADSLGLRVDDDDDESFHWRAYAEMFINQAPGLELGVVIGNKVIAPGQDSSGNSGSSSSAHLDDMDIDEHLLFKMGSDGNPLGFAPSPRLRLDLVEYCRFFFDIQHESEMVDLLHLSGDGTELVFNEDAIPARFDRWEPDLLTRVVWENSQMPMEPFGITNDGPIGFYLVAVSVGPQVTLSQSRTRAHLPKQTTAASTPASPAAAAADKKPTHTQSSSAGSSAGGVRYGEKVRYNGGRYSMPLRHWNVCDRYNSIPSSHQFAFNYCSSLPRYFPPGSSQWFQLSYPMLAILVPELAVLADAAGMDVPPQLYIHMHTTTGIFSLPLDLHLPGFLWEQLMLPDLAEAHCADSDYTTTTTPSEPIQHQTHHSPLPPSSSPPPSSRTPPPPFSSDRDRHLAFEDLDGNVVVDIFHDENGLPIPASAFHIFISLLVHFCILVLAVRFLHRFVFPALYRSQQARIRMLTNWLGPWYVHVSRTIRDRFNRSNEDLEFSFLDDDTLATPTRTTSSGNGGGKAGKKGKGKNKQSASSVSAAQASVAAAAAVVADSPDDADVDGVEADEKPSEDASESPSVPTAVVSKQRKKKKKNAHVSADLTMPRSSSPPIGLGGSLTRASSLDQTPSPAPQTTVAAATGRKTPLPLVFPHMLLEDGGTHKLTKPSEEEIAHAAKTRNVAAHSDAAIRLLTFGSQPKDNSCSGGGEEERKQRVQQQGQGEGKPKVSRTASLPSPKTTTTDVSSLSSSSESSAATTSTSSPSLVAAATPPPPLPGVLVDDVWPNAAASVVKRAKSASIRAALAPLVPRTATTTTTTTTSTATTTASPPASSPESTPGASPPVSAPASPLLTEVAASVSVARSDSAGADAAAAAGGNRTAYAQLRGVNLQPVVDNKRNNNAARSSARPPVAAVVAAAAARLSMPSVKPPVVPTPISSFAAAAAAAGTKRPAGMPVAAAASAPQFPQVGSAVSQHSSARPEGPQRAASQRALTAQESASLIQRQQDRANIEYARQLQQQIQQAQEYVPQMQQQQSQHQVSHYGFSQQHQQQQQYSQQPQQSFASPDSFSSAYLDPAPV